MCHHAYYLLVPGDVDLIQVQQDANVNEVWVKCIRENMPGATVQMCLLLKNIGLWSGSCLYRCYSKGTSCWYIVCTNSFRSL